MVGLLGEEWLRVFRAAATACGVVFVCRAVSDMRVCVLPVLVYYV